MGWWSSLVDGVSNAAGWVIDNASTIGTVVSTVGRVAGILPFAADEDPNDIGILSDADPFDMPIFINTMGKAEAVLKNAAKSASIKASETQASNRIDDETKITKQQTSSGLWAEPVTDVNGVPGQGMTSDLSHMLAMIQFPQTLNVGKTEEDVAQRLGQSIFRAPPVAPLAVGPSDEPYDVVTTSLISDDGSEEVFCSHAYYAIPSGGEGNEVSWHSAISLSTVQTSDSLNAYRQARAKAAKVPKAIKPSPVHGQDFSNIWQVTLNILWTAATYAAKAAPLVANYILQSGSILEIKYINTDGLTTFIQIKAAPGVSPFQAREAVLSAANSAVIDVEAQNQARTVKKLASPSKITSSGITQVDILANKLMPFDAPSSAGTGAHRTSEVSNGTLNGAKPNKAQRRLVSFQPFTEKYGDDFDSIEFEQDGARFYVPMFPISSRAKSAQV